MNYMMKCNPENGGDQHILRYDELPNSPIHEAPGHLVTVVVSGVPIRLSAMTPAPQPEDGICNFRVALLKKPGSDMAAWLIISGHKFDWSLL